MADHSDNWEAKDVLDTYINIQKQKISELQSEVHMRETKIVLLEKELTEVKDAPVKIPEKTKEELSNLQKKNNEMKKIIIKLLKMMENPALENKEFINNVRDVVTQGSSRIGGLPR